jgi:hypothetical protein
VVREHNSKIQQLRCCGNYKYSTFCVKYLRQSVTLAKTGFSKYVGIKNP